MEYLAETDPVFDPAAALAEAATLAAQYKAPGADDEPGVDEPVDPDPTTIKYDQRDALVSRIRSGEIPTRLAPALKVARELAAHGSPVLAAQAYLGHWTELTTTERSALLTAIYYQVPGEAGDAHLPVIDIDDLFGKAPIVIEQIRGVAKATSSSTDLMALGALAAASSALARKVEIHPGDGWTTYPHLYIAVEATSGAGKGPMTKRMGCLGAIRKWQADLVTRHEADHRRRRLDREILADERSDKKRALKKASPTDKAGLMAEVLSMDERLESPTPALPWFVANDVTPQRFVDMAHASGFVMLCHGEGKVILKAFTGKSDTMDGIGVWLSAWSVEDDDRDRVHTADKARPRDSRLAATCLLPLQPGVLAPTTPEAQTMLRDLADRGMFGRLIVARPRRVDVDESIEVELDNGARELQARYDALITGLCESAIELDPSRPLAPAQPAIARLDKDAGAAFLQFQTHYKAMANPGGPYATEFYEPVAQKHGEQALRIATVLAALRVGRFDADGFRVTLDDWQRAARFCENYVLPHALACSDRISLTMVGADAAEIARVVAERAPMTRSALRKGPFHTWDPERTNDRKDRFDPAFDTAVKKGLIIAEKRGKTEVYIAVRGAA